MVHHSRTSVYINAYNAYNKQQETLRRRNAVATLQIPKRMLFNSKKVTSGWGYSIVILLTNIVYVLLGTYVFMIIEGPAEEKEQRDDWIKQEHLLEHISGSETMLPKVTAPIVTMVTKMVTMVTLVRFFFLVWSVCAMHECVSSPV
eukprot:sb/3473839/